MDSQVDATQDILPTQESLEEEIIEIPDSLDQAMEESKHQFEVEQGMRARGEILPEGGIPVSNDLTEGSEENRAGIEGSKEKQAENEAEGELPSAPGAERWGEKHIRDKEKEQVKEENKEKEQEKAKEKESEKEREKKKEESNKESNKEPSSTAPRARVLQQRRCNDCGGVQQLHRAGVHPIGDQRCNNCGGKKTTVTLLQGAATSRLCSNSGISSVGSGWRKNRKGRF
jgi:hypothetical protein